MGHQTQHEGYVDKQNHFLLEIQQLIFPPLAQAGKKLNFDFTDIKIKR